MGILREERFKQGGGGKWGNEVLVAEDLKIYITHITIHIYAII